MAASFQSFEQLQPASERIPQQLLAR